MANQKTDSMQHRPVVGIMTGSLHTENSSKIGTAISHFFNEADVDIRLYQGLDARRYIDASIYLDKGFDYHYYSLFGYSRYERPDILIISFSTVSGVVDPLPLQEFLSHLPDVPVIIMEDDTEMPGCINVTIDNYHGMKSCLEHLLDVHGYRDIMFVSGPRKVADAYMRLRAFEDTMKEHDISVPMDRIVYGDFTENVDRLIEKALDMRGLPDAIVCANDDMAVSVYRVLKSRGLEPGRDIAVTGFDNIPTSRYMDPPLSTVYQDFRKVAKVAVEKAISYLSGDGDFTSCILPADFLVRASCGCREMNTNVEGDDESPFTDRVEGQRIIDQLKVDNIAASLLNRNLFTEDITLSGFFRSLGRQISLLNTKRSYICLLEEPKQLTDKDKMFTPDRLYLRMFQDGKDIRAYDETAPVIEPGELTDYTSGDTKSHMATFLLFYGNIHYGIMCVELDVSRMLFYYTMSLHIGSALRYLYLALDQKETLTMLREKNQILDYTASHDPLTGHLNRAGAMGEAFNLVHEHRKGSHFVAVMADLDHLKQINDTFGHTAGDDAICVAAAAIANALPEGSPLGRTGGDEFMALFYCGDNMEFTIDSFREKVSAYCEKVNADGSHPYYVGISLGCFEFETGTDIELPTILKNADEDLYKSKKKRRESVIR
ncbi:MAG: GGDEF domain-containing protein [Eubacterium sp.]|nr:GGDEF domain-containing protein [Eubacterium sp.]